MFSAPAHLYDFISQSFKDYRAEAARIAPFLKTEQPSATSWSMGRHRRPMTHELRLATRAEMEGAFTAAGLTATYDPVGLSGRGLYLARGLTRS